MYRASVESQGESSFLARTRHASFLMDTNGQASSPIDAAVAALCACVGHYVRDFLSAREIPCSGFAVGAEAVLAPDRPRLAKIELQIDLREARPDAALERELLAFIERCPLHGTLRQACTVDAVLAPAGDAGVVAAQAEG